MHIAIYLLLLIACCAFALWKGGAPERWGVAILLSAVAVSEIVSLVSHPRFFGVEIGYLAVDTLMFVAVCVLAMYAERYWPMVVAAVLMDQMITHLLMFSPKLMPFSYSVMLAIWSYVKPPLLAVATIRHQQRVRRFGADPDWSS